MNLFKRTALAAALFLSVFQPAAAQWQVPAHSVPVGRGAGNTGFTNAAPGAVGIPLRSSGPAGDPIFAPITNAGMVAGVANTFKGSLDGSTTSDVALIACTAAYQITKWVAGTGWQCGINPVLPSRTVAATINLSAYSVITTQAYSTLPGYGGASFQNVGSAPFKDSFIVSGTITNAGTGGTPGTYRSVQMNGGTGVGGYANIVVNGSGNVSSVTFVENGGNGYSALDVLTAASVTIGNTAGFTYRIDVVSTPLASFTDLAGTHWQYVPDGSIKASAFGAIFDWNASDGAATNNFAQLDAAFRFGALKTSNALHDQGGVIGRRVELPRGSGLVCGALTVFGAVMVDGQGQGNSVLKLCDSGVSGSSHFVTLGDPNTQKSTFYASLRNLTLFATATAPANSGIAMIYSNNVQQGVALENVSAYCGLRLCLKEEIGWGGAAAVYHNNVFFTVNPSSTNAGMIINMGTTLMRFHEMIIESPNSTSDAVVLSGGLIHFDTFHTEGMRNGFNVSMVAGFQASLRNASGGSLCNQLVTLQSTNTLGNFLIETAVKNGCTLLVTDGQAGSGGNQSADQMLQKVFSP